MQKFIDIFITIIIFIPIIAVLLYQIYFPRESVLFGKRWQFKNDDLEPSEEATKFTRNTSIIALIVIVSALIIGIIKECKG